MPGTFLGRELESGGKRHDENKCGERRADEEAGREQHVAPAGAVAFGESFEAWHFYDVLHGQSLRYFLLSRIAADVPVFRPPPAAQLDPRNRHLRGQRTQLRRRSQCRSGTALAFVCTNPNTGVRKRSPADCRKRLRTGLGRLQHLAEERIAGCRSPTFSPCLTACGWRAKRATSRWSARRRGTWVRCE